MKPQILVLSSTSNYLALNLEKDLKERPFTRLEHLEAYISSDRRSIPFLLILEVANAEDADRAVVAYDWAETIDPRAPARFLILAAKNITFGERTAKLRSLETAYVPINSRNLVFKVDLQLKLLEKTVAALPAEGTETPKPRRGFVAEMASLPGRPERVMVLRGATHGEWRRDPVPGAKVRWRWIDEEGPGQAGPAAEAEIKISWAAESSAPPAFEAQADGWVLSGVEPDVKAYRDEEEIFSARKVFFGAGPVAAPVLAQEAAAPRASERARDEAVQGFGRGAANRGLPDQVQGGEANGPPRAGELLVRASAEGTAGPAEEGAREGPSPFSSRPAAEGEMAQPKASAALEPYESPASGPPAGQLPVKREEATAARRAPAPDENTTYLSNKASSHAPGSISAAASNSQIIDTGKAQLQGTAAPSSGEPKVKEAAAAASAPGRPAPKRAATNAADEAEAAPARSLALPQDAGRTTLLSASAAPGAFAAKSAGADGTPSPEEEGAILTAEHEAREEFLRAGSSAEEAEGPASVLRKERGAQALPATGLKSGGAEETSAPQASHRTKRTPAEEMLAKLAARAKDAGTLTNFGRATSDGSGYGVRIEKEDGAERSDILVKEKTAEADEAILSGNAASRGGEAQVVANRASRRAEGEVYARASFIVALAELGDQNSSWQPAGHYRIYLSARHRYYGFRHEAELFPLWVYEGELAPEFLEEEKSWRFYDRRPEPYFTRAELPATLSEELFRLLPGPVAAAAAPAYVAGAATLPSSADAQYPGAPTPVKKLGLFSAVLAFVRRLFSN
jgi:hypothetical protein